MKAGELIVPDGGTVSNVLGAGLRFSDGITIVGDTGTPAASVRGSESSKAVLNSFELSATTGAGVDVNIEPVSAAGIYILAGGAVTGDQRWVVYSEERDH